MITGNTTEINSLKIQQDILTTTKAVTLLGSVSFPSKREHMSIYIYIDLCVEYVSLLNTASNYPKV